MRAALAGSAASIAGVSTAPAKRSGILAAQLDGAAGELAGLVSAAANRSGEIVATLAGAAALISGTAAGPPAAAFDFYISTTGNDANDGLTPATAWAITSLCRPQINAHNVGNRAKMAGKRIGLLPGIYAIYATLWSQAATYNFTYQQPPLSLPAGSPGARTFLGASDQNGRETIGSDPRATTHYITASTTGVPGGTLPGTSSSSIPLVGFDCRDTGGHIQIDGIAICDSQNLLTSCYGGIKGGSGQRASDCWVTRCHPYHCSGNEGNNTGAVWFGGGMDDYGVQNCIINDCQIPGANNHNCAGIFTEDALNGLYEYNTIYDCNCGIYDKNQNDGGHTYRYNYIEVNGSNPLNCLMDCAGGPSGTTSKVYNNILVIAPSTSSERSFWQGICTSPSPGPNPTQAMEFYNNTCYVLTGGSVQMGLTYQSQGAGSVKHCNNIYVAAAPGFYDILNFNSSTSAVAISDFNAYLGGCGAGSHFGRGTNGAPSTNYSLSAWQAPANGSLDTHSFALLSAGGIFVNPGQPQSPDGYKLLAGAQCASTGANPGSSDGTSGGSPVDMGAWGGIDVNAGGPIGQIGSTLLQ